MEVRPTTSLARLKVSDPKPQDSKEGKTEKASAGRSPTVVQLAKLENAVSDTQAAGRAIAQVATDAGKEPSRIDDARESARNEVEELNRQSSTASVRDVEIAADLANRLAGSILQNPPRAIDAQANQASSRVETLTQ